MITATLMCVWFKSKLVMVHYCIDITSDLLTKLMGPHLWDSVQPSI